MLGGLGVHAAGQPRCLIGVAVLAHDRRHLVRVRIFLDGGVAGGALQAAVQTGGEGVRLHADAMPGGVLQGHIPMTGQAIGLRMGEVWSRDSQKRAQRQRDK